MKHSYATFIDPQMAEKAGGALLDHGVTTEHMSIVLPDNMGHGTTWTQKEATSLTIRQSLESAPPH